MNSDVATLKALLISAAFMLVGMLLGRFLARYSGWVPVGVSVLLMGVAAALVLSARHATDVVMALGQAVVATIFVAPTAFGVMVGLFTWLIWRRRS
jgi:F0F1-type ATP synthase assembly protein I